MSSLDQLHAGQCATITAVQGGDALGQRLLEMGLLEGEQIEVLGFAPFGDPMEIRLRDYRLSLRKREAARVSVEVRTATVAAVPPLPVVENESQEWQSAPPVTSSAELTAALTGNPNTGKTTLFNALAGMRQRVGNYPGVTVETKRGQMTAGGRTVHLVDLPGTYSLAPRSPDEMLAVDLVLGRQPGEPRPGVLISIVDASNLERNLYLTTQLLEIGLPVVVALNMIDVAEGQGLRIDAEKLSRRLGVPVVPIQANKHKGLERLKQAIAAEAHAADGPVFPEAFEAEVSALRTALGDVPVFLLRRLLLDVGGHTEQRFLAQHGETLREQLDAARHRLAQAGCAVPDIEAHVRYAWIRDKVSGCVQRPSTRPVAMTDRLDRVLTHRLWGTLIFAAVMALIFQAIFSWANPLMDAIKAGKSLLAEAVRGPLGTGPLSSLLADGVIEGVGSVLVFLPQILILFGFVALLEDCGYMARVAFLMDKLMARCGLSGKSFVPMLSSVACAVPGILATRTIEQRRDRLATILVAPLMSCSARLPVYTLMIGAFFPVRSEETPGGYSWWVPGLILFCMYSLGVVLAPMVAFVLKRTLLKGETPPFVLEMPVYRWPALTNVLRRMTDSAAEFVKRAGTIIVAAMIVVWALLYFPQGSGPGGTYDERVAGLNGDIRALKEKAEEAKEPEKEALEQEIGGKEEKRDELLGEWKRQSWLGRMGRMIEPVVEPLGWDWKIGMAALASFPAREVIVGTLGMIYNLGQGEPDELKDKLSDKMRAEEWEGQPGRKVFTTPVALSIMVFFALCCQCASTLAVIRRETRSWGWPLLTFVYMTVLAYVGALGVYQLGTWLAN